MLLPFLVPYHSFLDALVNLDVNLLLSQEQEPVSWQEEEEPWAGPFPLLPWEDGGAVPWTCRNLIAREFQQQTRAAQTWWVTSQLTKPEERPLKH